MADQSRLRSLRQTLSFPSASADDLARLFAEAPLVGDASIFGDRTVRSTVTKGDVRTAYGFEPAPIPLLRFDTELHQQRSDDGVQIIVTFSQPDKKRPYLAGQFVWILNDSDDGTAAALQEEINTPAALAIVDEPLTGHPWSFRRFLFFSGGHKRLMGDVKTNISALL